MALSAGQTLQNRYRILSLLGQGGMGAVYKAWDTRLNVYVAVKEMIPQPGLDPQTLARLRQQFQQEATVLARLSHPNLVRVSDFFEEGGNAYLVMEFVEGKSLADLITEQGALPETQVLAWAAQLLDALAYCHAQGIIHRDIKPQNIIIRADGRPVLVDFGLVKLWDPRDPRTQTVIRAIGTPEYAPPEQYGISGHTDPRSDLYSLGATLYHALTGQPPLSAMERMARPGQFRPLRALAPRVRAATEAAVMRAMELAVDMRFASAAEMRAALRTKGIPTAITLTLPLPSAAQAVVPLPPVVAPAVPWLWTGLAGIGLLMTVLCCVIILYLKPFPPFWVPTPRSAVTLTPLLSPSPFHGPTSTPTLLRPAPVSPSVSPYGKWETRTPMSIPRDRPAAVALEGKIYVIGGTNDSGALASVEVYDPSTDTWTPKANMPGPKSAPGAAVVNGRIFVVGPPDNRLYEYDPQSDTWTVKAPLPENPVDSVAVATISGRIFVVFPVRGEAKWRLYVYNPFQNMWERRNDHPDSQRSIASLGVSNGMIYAVGGGIRGLVPQETTRVDLYDPARDQWTLDAIAPLETRRTHLGSTLPTIYGRMFVIGGWDGYTELSDVEVYDPWANEWSSLAHMPTARYRAASVAIGYKIYVLGGNQGGTGEHPLATNEELTLPEPAQKENPIVFVSDFGNVYYEIFTINPDGSHRLRLTSDGCANWHPQWTADGQRILFSSDCEGNRDIYSMNPDGSDWRRLTSAPGSEHRPFMSPDGKTIAFVSNASGEEHIWLINADGTLLRQLTMGPGTEDDTAIAWSPDSRQIVFRSTRDGTWQLWRINIDGTGLKRLTALTGEAHDPAWSPDGSTIAFSSQGEIMLMDPDGSNFRVLPGPGWESRPDWSPDGAFLIFSSFRGEFADIYLRRIGETGERNLTNTAESTEWDPAW